MTDTTADMMLASNALAGCQRSWSEIVTTHSNSLLKCIYRELPKIGFTKDDILQFFWLAIFKSRLAKYNGKSPLNYFLKAELRARMGDLVRASKTNRENVIDHFVDIHDTYHYLAGSHNDSPCLVIEAQQLIDSKGLAA